MSTKSFLLDYAKPFADLATVALQGQLRRSWWRSRPTAVGYSPKDRLQFGGA